MSVPSVGQAATDTSFVRNEPLRVRWGRRAITVPVLFSLLALYLLLLPVLIPVAIAADLFRRRSWIMIRCGAFFGWYLLVECVTVVVIALAWTLRILRPGLLHARFVHWNWVIQKNWSHALYRGAMRLFSLTTRVDGDTCVRTGPLIIFMRHVSMADTILPLVLIGVRHEILLRYVLKSELLWDPPIDIAGQVLPNVFVRRGSGDGERETALVRALAHDLGPSEGVVIYPEGTRFTPEKREKIIASIIKRDPASAVAAAARALKNLLPVHPGGPMVLLDANEGADVAFCGHVGLEGTTHLRDFLNGALLGSTLRVKFWRVPFTEIPKDPDARTMWLYDWWQRVDQWIGEQSR